MTRIYENPGVAKRSNISLAILVAVILYGLWDLWYAWSRTGINLSIDAMFGILFIGGGAYGLWRTMTDTRDLVTSFDLDGDRAAITLWRPFKSKRVETDLGRLTNWRYYVKIAQRNMRTFFVFVDSPDHPHPLQFELVRGMVPSDELRKLAPDAIADFERDTGVRPEPPEESTAKDSVPPAS